MFHSDLLEVRTIEHVLVAMRGADIPVVTRIAARESEVLPRLCANPLGNGVEHKKAFVEFEKCHHSVGRGDRQRDTPRKPIEDGLGVGTVGLQAEEGGNCEGADRHCDTEHIEQKGVDATPAAVFVREEAVPGLDGLALVDGEVRKGIEHWGHIVLVGH